MNRSGSTTKLPWTSFKLWRLQPWTWTKHVKKRAGIYIKKWLKIKIIYWKYYLLIINYLFYKTKKVMKFKIVLNKKILWFSITLVYVMKKKKWMYSTAVYFCYNFFWNNAHLHFWKSGRCILQYILSFCKISYLKQQEHKLPL